MTLYYCIVVGEATSHRGRASRLLEPVVILALPVCGMHGMYGLYSIRSA